MPKDGCSLDHAMVEKLLRAFLPPFAGGNPSFSLYYLYSHGVYVPVEGDSVNS